VHSLLYVPEPFAGYLTKESRDYALPQSIPAPFPS
jgi:hypothetical protein